MPKYFTLNPSVCEDQYYYAKDLKSAFNSLDNDWVNKLTINSGTHRIDPFSQFCAFFKGRRLAYPKNEEGLKMATDMLLMIFYDNVLAIEQIGKSKEVAKELGNFENWADVSRSGSASRNKSIGDNSTISYNEDTSKLTSTGATTNKASDDNSYSNEETGVVPVNSLSKQDVQNTSSDNKSNKNAATTVSGTVGEGVSASFTHSSNAAADYIAFLKLDPQKILFKFWRNFDVMFYRT